MKRFLGILVVMLLCASVSLAQSGINIKSFSELPTDLDARAVNPEYDQNGKRCALVKVVTTEGDFTFDNGILGVVKALHKPELSEWWVYLPEKTMKLKITHPVYGQLNDTEDGYYYFPNMLKEATCYRLELTTMRKVVTYEEERVKTGFFVLNSRPEGAQVYLEENGVENYIGDTPAQKKLPYGNYHYRIKKSMYRDEVGVVEVDKNQVLQEVVLRPAFGSLRVTSQPTGAKVTIDNDDRTYTTPCIIEKVPSGSLGVSIVLPRYGSQRHTVSIKDGEETPLHATLEPRFAMVKINSLPGATIEVNGRSVATGTYRGELEEGIYDIEVSLSSHRSASRQIIVAVGQPQELTLNPTPIYGTLDVITQPIMADILLNGKNYGKSPMTIDNLLIGNYEVELSKQGCATVRREVNITENNLSVIEVALPQGCEVSIISGKVGDKVYIDHDYVGLTPYKGIVSCGSHTVEIKQGSGVSCQMQDIDIPTTVSHYEVAFSWGLLQPRWAKNVTAKQREVIQQLIDDMVEVEGGTFMMGATPEQGDDAYKSEKPVHEVTLSSYMICKYEVTQTLWEAVMGMNPSYFKGDTNCPVDSVSWNDCQEFIKKLNQLTGLTFRLPTEAEWEYAARGGVKTRGYKYSGSNNIDEVARYNCNSKYTTFPVGLKKPNELGLYDMSGNVWEWCQDYHDYYSANKQTNPKGPRKGYWRVQRGGSFVSAQCDCRVSQRNSSNQNYRIKSYGLRLVCVP